MTATSNIVRRIRRSLSEVTELTRPALSERNIGYIKLALPNVLKRIRPVRGQVDSDRRNASEWFQRGNVAYEKRQYGKALAAWKKASQEANAEACYRIGRLYARGEGVVKSIPDAVVWYRCAADLGHVEAQYQLGTIYINGESPGPSGPDNWLKSASRRDSAAATRNLETLFPNGIAVEKDLDAAIRWITAAARNGKAEAQNILAEMYRRGIGIAQDYESARDWYLLAAAQGNASAQFGLGDIYYQGLGVEVDHRAGAEWYEKAAK